MPNQGGDNSTANGAEANTRTGGRDADGTALQEGGFGIGDSLKEVHKKELEGLINKLRPQDGVKELPTGDYLVRDDGRQILFMPNGDKLTMNPDGSYDLKSEGPVRVSSKGGVTTLEYPNGDRVAFDKQGPLFIQRDDQAIHFGRIRPFPGQPKHPFNRDDIKPTIPGGWGGKQEERLEFTPVYPGQMPKS